MNYRSGNPADLAHLETFVWQAIFPAFDHPELTEEQRAANDQVVEEARNWAVRAMGREDEMLYIAHDPARGQLAGLIWAKGGNNPRIVLIIVARRYWGQGVAAKLLEEATFWLGDSKPVSARVRHYNERAQAFFAKHGFEITEEVDDDFPIQRVIMLRPAGYQSEAEDDMDQLDLGFEFPEPELEPSNTTEDLLDLTEPYAQRRASDTPPPISKFPHIELEIESAGADKEEKPFQSEAEPKDNLTAAEAIGDDLPPFEFAFQPPVKTQYVKTQNFASPDSASPDSASPDSASPDSASPDSASPDSASPDSTSPDSTSPDSTSPDSTSPDSTSPDSTSPDSTSPDSASPDSASPDSASPDSASPATDHTDIHYTPPPLEPLPDVTEEDLLEDALILEEITPESQTESGLCNNCGADLPEGARFCPQCGHPVDDTPVKTQNFASPSSPPPPPPTDTEGSPHLRKSEPNTPPHGEQHFQDPDHSFTNTRGKNLGGIDWDGSLMTDFRTFFKDRFQQRVQDYFGEQAVDRYEDARRQSDFQQTVSTQLAALADWVRNHRAESNWRNEQGYNRLVAATEALIEYFLVEATRKLHGGIWPQRLLRHQALSWDKADLFSMAMDYLDFEDESETYYTDFVRMPARVLKNATNRFLNATRDERVLFVCDQSLLGSGKDGYALTDVAIYWRPVLQGPQRVLYQEIETLEKQADHLRINGLYFDAGASLNYKMALLLRRLATMISTYAA